MSLPVSSFLRTNGTTFEHRRSEIMLFDLLDRYGLLGSGHESGALSFTFVREHSTGLV